MPDLLCPDDHELLPLLADVSGCAQVRGHLAGCPSCRERLQRLQIEVANLRQTGAGAPPSASFFPASNSVSDKGQETEEIPATIVSPQPITPTGNQRGAAAPDGDRPAVIGKFLILDALGKGGQAKVYRAFHPTLGREVVIKLSRRPLDVTQADRDHFVAEGKLLADLHHPNLARVYDLDFHEGCPFLVIEYVRGRNLRQVAGEHPFNPRQAAVLVAKVARALAIAHRRGVLHQDIKPENILIDETGQPRLIDFGLARLRDAWAGEADEPGSISGTPAYMAPEQARGETDRVDQRSDVFALGAVLYQLLVGKAPFAGKDDYDALARAARCDFDGTALRDGGVPRRLEAICLRAMAADPANRYSTAEDLAAGLEQFLRRPRVLLAWAIAAALAGTMIGAAFLLRTGTPTDRPVDITLGQANLKNELPLRSGDLLTIRCRLPTGIRSAKLFWFDTDGELVELTPTSGSGTEVVYPEEEKRVPLTGPPGTEFVLVCARQSGPALTHADIAKHLQIGRPLFALPAHTMVLMDRDKVEVHRERGLGKVEVDPVYKVQVRLEQLRRDLRDHCEFIAGVAFPHQ